MKYRPLMLLGTGSDVGKSLMTAALCRIFRQDGIRVAPFKAQNMALNSFITPEGGEMGRAQVVQAQAAGVEPHVDMNPILLKPTAEVGSQVILQGKVYGDYAARDYYALKPKLARKVMESYRRLSERYELIVMEGAGSAAELNLKKNDLVNFAMAKRADAHVILVADIDRGGIFPATIGTWHLLTRGERQRLAGFIVNKFRGDPSLFEDGVQIIQKRTGRPVFGVVPHARDLAIPEEDSVALDRHGRDEWASGSALRVGVVRLPHISNYTDFDPLEQEAGLALRYLDHRDPFEDADVLILPGSKNTIEDLIHLKRTGLFQRIRRFERAGGRVVGICGGYQLLGKVVRDPLGVEGPPREEEGLGLLDLDTTMAGEKTTTQVKARALDLEGSGHEIVGYEIHMGLTEPTGEGTPAVEIVERTGRPERMPDGWVRPDRRVWGTYIHGIFDADDFRRAFLKALREERGLGAPEGDGDGGGEAPELSFRAFQEAQFDKLADLVRENVDMEKIRALIEKEQ
jgi:adenosylcobyric acid synthase